MKAARTFQNRGKTAGALSAVLLAGLFAATAYAKPAPPLDPADVTRGAEQFDRSYRSEGMTGARTYSERCHAAAGRTRSWARRDFCVAFDLSAELVDESMAQGVGFPPDPYFAMAARSALREYGRLSRNRGLIEKRIGSIRERVEAVMADVAEAGATRR
jgi:hypothetical protein